MLLAIDIGNTRIKYAVFEHNTVLETHFFEKKNCVENIVNILNKFQKIKNLLIAAVGETQKEDFLTFQKRLKVHFISHEDHFPFFNKYQTPKTLGIDRMVLAAGATLLYPTQNKLIIDAGTCITYDFVDQNNNYLGGSISPGIQLRYKSLHQYTAKLPLLEPSNTNHYLGNTTSEAIHTGVIEGVTFEIEGFINQYSLDYSNFIIILTGGDTDFLAKRLKNTIFANSNFLLESLNNFFQYINNK